MVGQGTPGAQSSCGLHGGSRTVPAAPPHAQRPAEGSQSGPPPLVPSMLSQCPGCPSCLPLGPVPRGPLERTGCSLRRVSVTLQPLLWNPQLQRLGARERTLSPCSPEPAAQTRPQPGACAPLLSRLGLARLRVWVCLPPGPHVHVLVVCAAPSAAAWWGLLPALLLGRGRLSPRPVTPVAPV